MLVNVTLSVDDCHWIVELAPNVPTESVVLEPRQMVDWVAVGAGVVFAVLVSIRLMT